MSVVKVDITPVWFYKSVTPLIICFNKILQDNEKIKNIVLNSIADTLVQMKADHFSESENTTATDTKAEASDQEDSDTDVDLEAIRKETNLKVMFHLLFSKMIKDIGKSALKSDSTIFYNFSDTLWAFAKWSMVNNDFELGEYAKGIRMFLETCLPGYSIESA